MKSYRINHGGLMRCCVDTIAHLIDAREEDPPDGETFDCIHEKEGNQSIVFKDGVWRWNKDG